MLEKRRRFYELRRALGKKKLLKEIKKSRGRETNYVNDQLHKISTDIVRIAAKYPNAVIVFENLTHIRNKPGQKCKRNWSKKDKRKLHSWAFRKLEEMIEYKAHNNGIAIRRSDPRGTSSTCKGCFGSVRRRPSIRAACKNAPANSYKRNSHLRSQTIFLFGNIDLQTCKKVYTADWLGAVNIVRRLFYYMLNNPGCSESSPRRSIDELVAEGTALGVDLDRLGLSKHFVARPLMR